MIESYKIHCFNCGDGELIRAQETHADLGPMVSYSCTRCAAYKLIYIDSAVLPLQTYYFPSGRTISMIKPKTLHRR